MHDPSPHLRGSSSSPWWPDKVIYRVDLRSFSDSDNDGIGDLDGLRQRLGYVDLLGVDAVWLTGVLASPIGKGRGHEVDPTVGTGESLVLLIDEAHASGLRVVIDTPVSSRDIDTSEARERIAATMDGWAQLGVDGVRLSASPGVTTPFDEAAHDVLAVVRPVVDRYPRCLIGALVERWFTRRGPLDRVDVGIDERFCTAAFDAAGIRDVITRVLAESAEVGAVPAWGLSDWLNPRPVTRLGGGAVGVSRAKAMVLVQCALPGVVGVDNGTELGLAEPDVRGRPDTAPVRDLMPWEGTRPPFGFSGTAHPWWPSAPDRSDSTVEVQLEDPLSTLSLYRRALQIRREHSAEHGTRVRWYGAPDGCLAFRRENGGLTCALNTSPVPVPRPPGDLLLSSEPLDSDRIPPNTAAWLI